MLQEKEDTRRKKKKKKRFSLFWRSKLFPLDLMYTRIAILRSNIEYLQFYRTGCFSYPKKAFLLYYGYDACQTDPYI